MSLIDGIPNWLAKHPNGKYLISECISDSQILDYERIVISILAEDNEKYHAKAALERIVAKIVPTPEIVVLEERTSGPAETVYQTIKKAGIAGSIVIRDSDVKLLVSTIAHANFIIGIDLMECSSELPDIRSKAFLKVNENGIILDVIEKQVSSNKICYGMYGFSNCLDFVDAYEALCDFNYDMTQLFVSNIIAYLIGTKDQIFHYIQAQDYEDWDSRQSWNRLKRRFSTYFINLDAKGIEHNFPKLRILEDNGAQLVFYSALPHIQRERAELTLKQNGFAVPRVLMECNCGEYYLINAASQLEAVAETV